MTRLACLTLLLWPLSASAELPTVSEDAYAACVRVVAWRGLEGGSGSGVVVAKGATRKGEPVAFVLTSRHVCTPEAPEYRVYFPSGPEKLAWLHAVDARADLALLVLNDPKDEMPCASVAPRDPEAGERVWQAGYPNSRGPRLAFGVFTGESRLFDGKPDRGITFQVDLGDSGSGVFRGRHLIGVLQGGKGNRESIVPLADVRRFLKARCPAWRE